MLDIGRRISGASLPGLLKFVNMKSCRPLAATGDARSRVVVERDLLRTLLRKVDGTIFCGDLPQRRRVAGCFVPASGCGPRTVSALSEVFCLLRRVLRLLSRTRITKETRTRIRILLARRAPTSFSLSLYLFSARVSHRVWFARAIRDQRDRN